MHDIGNHNGQLRHSFGFSFFLLSFTNRFIYFYFIYMSALPACVCVCVCVCVCGCVYGCTWCLLESNESIGATESKVANDCGLTAIWVLRTELRSSGRPISVLNR